MRAARSRVCRACAWAACRTRRPCRCAIPGRATPGRGARLLRGELEFGGGVRALRPGALGRGVRIRPAGCLGARLHLAARPARSRHRCGPAARPRAGGGMDRLAARRGAGAPSGRRRRADHRLARPLRFLRRHRRRCIPPEADGAAGVRRPQPVGRAAGRGAGRAGADRVEGTDRRGRRAAGARRLPDARAALPAAGDRPPGAAGRLPCRTQPGRAACRLAGPDRDPRAAAGRADAAAARAHQRDRAHGAGAAGDAARRWRPGAVQRQQGGEQQPDRYRADPGGTQRPRSRPR